MRGRQEGTHIQGLCNRPHYVLHLSQLYLQVNTLLVCSLLVPFFP